MLLSSVARRPWSRESSRRTAVAWPQGTDGTAAADRPPTPDAPTMALADAQRAVEGRDYRVLASYTNENLDRDNGQYFDGVTDDGQILFRDGPRADQLYPRLALMDPSTGAKDWLPNLTSGRPRPGRSSSAPTGWCSWAPTVGPRST